MGILDPFWDMRMSEARTPFSDAAAFEQMQRFIDNSARALRIDSRFGYVYIRNYDDERLELEGWDPADPKFRGSGETFAAAWEKFCGYWPEAGRS